MGVAPLSSSHHDVAWLIRSKSALTTPVLQKTTRATTVAMCPTILVVTLRRELPSP